MRMRRATMPFWTRGWTSEGSSDSDLLFSFLFLDSLFLMGFWFRSRLHWRSGNQSSLRVVTTSNTTTPQVLQASMNQHQFSLI